MANLTPFYVYILECSDRSYYVGLTSDVERRIVEHNTGTYQGYTASRRPVKLLW
ncbi:MAG TPA: GIY-YIG nuclease family protein, partial [Bacteroidota bacterium]|nr:GIY-YIG nuclease family protein [Bacteroidota bacterium]